MKTRYYKTVMVWSAALFLVGCSSPINPLYGSYQNKGSAADFSKRHSPRDNRFIEAGGFAKKKKNKGGSDTNLIQNTTSSAVGSDGMYRKPQQVYVDPLKDVYDDGQQLGAALGDKGSITQTPNSKKLEATKPVKQSFLSRLFRGKKSNDAVTTESDLRSNNDSPDAILEEGRDQEEKIIAQEEKAMRSLPSPVVSDSTVISNPHAISDQDMKDASLKSDPLSTVPGVPNKLKAQVDNRQSIKNLESLAR
ncbi:hypothetical protein EDM53_01025 [Rickettsiales endosymbiont of Peranema trichophorum]|uniref:hypothetical protein n=1 Tax=Rickettsiales endosymbiont of Peranema trichophorum TaxID=2486577 RepID=UPI001023498B|nr:hypothetical protein [Rickettsiales endosymbiont of Peranema trichophorum]RZI47624.1 hypothetical protein EDM53_01025 [Rickettsiales endosymbiont of Peranema trichophorum]